MHKCSPTAERKQPACRAGLGKTILWYACVGCTWSSSMPCGSPRHACQGKICSYSTSKHGNSSDEWLQTEHTSVTEPKAKQNSAISLGRERPGICFTIFGLLSSVVCIVYEVVSVDTLHKEFICSNVYDNMHILTRIRSKHLQIYCT